MGQTTFMECDCTHFWHYHFLDWIKCSRLPISSKMAGLFTLSLLRTLCGKFVHGDHRSTVRRSKFSTDVRSIYCIVVLLIRFAASHFLLRDFFILARPTHGKVLCTYLPPVIRITSNVNRKSFLFLLLYYQLARNKLSLELFPYDTFYRCFIASDVSRMVFFPQKNDTAKTI